MLGASWKTTSAGILAICTSIVTIWFAISSGAGLSPEVIMAAVAQILGGLGLLFARDNNVTSEQVAATKKPTEPEDQP